MKIGAGISTFDDCLGLQRTVLSVFGEVDKIIVVNGRYTNFNADHDYSIDNTKEYCNHIKDIHYDEFTGWEWEKRQRIFDIAGNMGIDYLIIIDSDEYVTDDTDWHIFFTNLELADLAGKKTGKPDYCYNIWMHIPKDWPQASNNLKPDQYHKVPRVFKDPSKLRYALQTHYKFTFRCIPDQMIIDNPDIPLCIGPTRMLQGLRITTDAKFRSPEYQKVREQWSFDNMHDDRARVFYQEMRASGKDNPEWDINIPHYYDESGKRINGKRPLIQY